MSSIDRIKTLKDAFEALGLNQQEETPFANPKNDRQKAANAFLFATVLVEALNEGRKPDYDNRNEVKYEIWWDMRSEAAGGPGFAYYHCGLVSSRSDAGARLVFFDRKVAIYAATHFLDVFKAFMTFHKE
jgi:hypothetical protein